jgi:hypothetical protein
VPLPRIKFSWKPTISGREEWRWGLWMPVYGKSGRLRNYKIMVRGVLLWLGSLALVAYLSLTTAWFFTLNQRPSNLVTWVDCVVAPLRWDTIRIKRGDAYIIEGMAAMNEQKWNEAVLKIEAGLSRSPNNRVGRRQLGFFFGVAGQRERGLKLLAEGFERYFPGREDTEVFLRVAIDSESYNQALAVLDRSMKQKGAAAEREFYWLADQKTRVFVLAKRFEDVLSWIDQQTAISEVMWESRVISLIELQRFDEARNALDNWEAATGLTRAVQRIQVRLAREDRNLPEMRTILDKMRSLDTQNPQPWVYSLIQEYLAEEPEAAAQELDGFLLRFGGKEQTLLLAARPLAEIEAWALFRVVETRFIELGFETTDFNLLRSDAAVTRGDFEVAKSILDDLSDDQAIIDAPAQMRKLETMRSLVEYFISGEDAARAKAVETIGAVPFALNTLRQFLAFTEIHGKDDVSLQILDVARRRFPTSELTLQAYERLKFVMGDRARPEVEIPLVQDGDRLDLDAEIRSISTKEEGALGVLSARQFFAQSAAMIDRQAWSELSDLLRELRRVRPTWASSFGKEITQREIELNTAQKNWPALVGNVRSLLDGSVPRGLEVMALVRHLEAKQERIAAETILAEVERRHKDFPPARQVRRDWAEQARREQAEQLESAEEPPTPSAP